MTSSSVTEQLDASPALDIALRCRTLTRQLVEGGHGILARQMYEFFRADNFKALMSFLGELNRCMPSINTDELSHRLTHWARTGEPLQMLLQEPDFVHGEADATGNSIQDFVRGKKLDELSDTLRRLLDGDYSEASPQAREPTPGETALLHEKLASSPVGEHTAHTKDDQVTTQRPTPPKLVSSQSASGEMHVEESTFLSPPLVVGLILMCQILTIFFCFYR